MGVFEVTYQTKSGAHVSEQTGDGAKVIAFLERHKGEARVRKGGEVVGGVEYRPEMFEDGRTKWWWWYDEDALAGGKP